MERLLAPARSSGAFVEFEMNKISRRITIALIALICVFIVILTNIHSAYEREREIVGSIGVTTYFARFDESVVCSLGPDTIGYFRWNGPVLLERPMRSLGIPWFDRIERIHIRNDSALTADTLNQIVQLPNLQILEIASPSISESKYRDAVNLAEGRIDLSLYNR